MNTRSFSRGIAGLAAAVSLLGCHHAPTPIEPTDDPTKDIAALNAENDALNAAVKARDADKIVACDTEDTVAWIPHAPAIHGRAEDLAGWKKSFADPAFAYSQTVRQTEVARSGDIAYETGSYMLTDTNPTTHRVEHLSGNWIDTFRKGADGVWRSSAFAATQSSPRVKASSRRRCPC